MNKFVELPLVEPIYRTYHNQGAASAIIESNRSIRNWYLNQVMNLSCSRKFLTGFTSPQLYIPYAAFTENPYLDKIKMTSQFTKGYINFVIREMLDQGYYVAFSGIDDYYVPNKSWYKERHANHDGLICGYNQQDKTYCIYAHDSNWIYRKFWTPQKDFDRGRVSMLNNGVHTTVWALKPMEEQVELNPNLILVKLKEYLKSDLDMYPFDASGIVFGAVVHEYIAKYVAKLYDGSVEYEKMDRRIFRLIWEHKKAMLERIRALEQVIKIGKRHGNKYEEIVAEADKMRMLYASHHIKRRDSVLPIIHDNLLNMYDNERKILSALIRAMEKELNKDAVETPQR